MPGECQHPKALPNAVDAWVAIKPPAQMRVWLTDAAGNAVGTADLHRAIAAIAAPPVAATAALVVQLTRDGAAAAKPGALHSPPQPGTRPERKVRSPT